MNPKNLSQFIGKEKVINTLKIGIKAQMATGKQLDHILLYGPPGVGKTSLANAVANELNRKIKIVQGANISELNDLIGIISTLRKGDVLFIDEIHTIKKDIAEMLYPALENKAMDLIVGKNLNKRSIRINLPDFTLIAATTNLGNITRALEERFGYVFYLDAYTPQEMRMIVAETSKKMELNLDEGEINEIVNSSKCIPRNAVRILRRVKDYQSANERISVAQIIKSCGFVYQGLSDLDVKYLMALKDNCHSLTSISYRINLDEKTIVNKIEPYMYSKGLIVKSNRGRSLSAEGLEILKKIRTST